ncbi:MAG: flagellar hook-associated protein FlgK [Methyloprofundus sp.]|nr:flagellar hook-associated protein FlgK [Methyloprofundus sp.]
MASGILGTAVSGLMAFQRSIETTSHNIANVNTEGYSRQRVESVANLPERTGGGYVGTGVEVTNIARSYDQFITGQLRSSHSAFGEVEAFKSFAAQVDNLLADPSTGMDPAIQSFFNSVNDVANDPSDIAAREVMLIEGDSLTQRFGLTNARFEELRHQVNSDVTTMTQTINTYTETLADLNKRISADLGRANGQQQPNDLLDERDHVLNQLAELVDIAVVPQANGMMTVLLSNGQPLVIDGQASKMGVQGNEFDPTKLDITLRPEKGGPLLITSQIKGGKLAGTLRFRDEILDPAQQKVGAVAAAIAIEFNSVHAAGYDLDGNGNPGQDFFKFTGVAEVPVMALTTNTGAATVTAAFDVTSTDIDTSDYLLVYDGAYKLTRMSDDSVISLTASAGPAPITLTATPPDVLPGITLELDATPAVDDQFFIRPTFQAAKDIAMNITDPREVAAATNVETDPTTGVVSVFVGAMPGDNRNALSLAALASNSSMFGGTASFQEAFGQVVSKVGGLTHAANISASAQESLLYRATEARENISGVNLDEEAANLIKFQQSYQAAAQAISTASTLFDSLIGAVR